MSTAGIVAPQPAATTGARLGGVHRTFHDGTRETQVLRGIDLELPAGGLYVILGASGSGKTTLLNILGGIDRADRGEVEVAGMRLDRASAAELVQYRRGQVGFIFQFYNLMPTLTAEENVEIALEHLGLPTAERRQRAQSMLEAVGLGLQPHKFPSQMSGGEQQRVAVARALVRRPPLLLCDEPTGNLDLESGRSVVDLIERLRKESGATAVVVTHNPDLFPRADRVMRMRDGRLL